MDKIAQEFILSDLKRGLSSATENATALTADNVDDQTWLNWMDQWLRNAEQESISREKVTSVNPHINMGKGSALKRLLKRIIRKMIYWFLQPVVVQQSGYNTLNNDVTNQLRDSICVLKDVVVSQQKLICRLEQRLIVAENRIAEVMANGTNRIAQLNERICEEQREYTEQKMCLTKVMEQIGEVDTRVSELEKPEDSIHDYMDYARFEEKFRGSQEEIRNRIRRYLEYFSAGDRVLDLGCGRGEWLELLKSIGANPFGVDLNENTVALCRKKGLNVVQGDLFQYLEEQEDNSLNGITAIQVVEHITPVQLVQLTQLCYRKLKFGGHIIFETQNPAVVYTMTTCFLVDPTHIRPVHPTWAKYVLEDAGFSNVTLDYPEYAWVTDGSIPPLDIPNSDTAAFNQQIGFLNNMLYGSTDYAVIGIKK